MWTYALNLDLFWLSDENPEDGDRLPPPAELAAEIIQNLQAVLEEVCGVVAEWGTGAAGDPD